MVDKSEKKSRNAITLNTKIQMIKLSDERVSQAEIGRRLGFPRTTVNTVIKNRQKILAEFRSATPINTTIIRKRDGLIADMERLLIVWIDDQTSHHIPLNQAIIQNKAQSIFNDLKIEKGEAAKDAEFGASRGWFDRFKKRSNLHNMKVCFENHVPEMTENIEKMEVEPQNVAELIEIHSQLLDNKEQRQEEDEEIESKGLTSEILSKAFNYFEAGMALLVKHDPDFERSSAVNANIVRDYACYTEMYREMKIQSTSQTTLKKRPVPSTSSENPSIASTSIQSPTSSTTPSRNLSKRFCPR